MKINNLTIGIKNANFVSQLKSYSLLLFQYTGLNVMKISGRNINKSFPLLTPLSKAIQTVNQACGAQRPKF